MAPHKDIKAVENFLRFFDSMGFDIQHPFLRDFRPDNYESVKALRDEIASASSYERADEVLLGTKASTAKAVQDGFLRAYWKNFVRMAADERWSDITDAFAVADAFTGFKKTRLGDGGIILHSALSAFVKENFDSCDETLKKEICTALKDQLEKDGDIEVPRGMVEKALDVERWKNKPGHQVERIWEHTGGGLIKAMHDGGDRPVRNVSFSERKTAFKGFKIFDVSKDGGYMGVILAGNPAEGAMAGLRIAVRGSVSAREIERDFPGLQYQGAVAQESSNSRIPLGTVAVKGETKRIDFDKDRLDGLIMVFPDGEMRIINSWNFRLSDITRDPKDSSVKLMLKSSTALDVERFVEEVKEQNITLITAPIFTPRGKKGGEGGERAYSKKDLFGNRLLFKFKSGVFGMFNAGDGVHINTALAIIYSMQDTYGGLDFAALCDRGMWDTAVLYQKGADTQVLGSVNDDPSNRLFFYGSSRN